MARELTGGGGLAGGWAAGDIGENASARGVLAGLYKGESDLIWV